MHTYVAVPAGATSVPLADLRAWESLMRRSIEAARCGNTALAGHLCAQALLIAEALLGPGHEDLSADDRLAAFVVTHLQFADLHAEQGGDIDAAALYRCRAHQTLMALLRDPQAEPALQQAACRHSRETHAALLLHLIEHGSHPAIVAALHAGCMPIALPSVPGGSNLLH